MAELTLELDNEGFVYTTSDGMITRTGHPGTSVEALSVAASFAVHGTSEADTLVIKGAELVRALHQELSEIIRQRSVQLLQPPDMGVHWDKESGSVLMV